MIPPEHDDPLADLRAHLQETREAAERLAGEASAAREQAPPGWSQDDHQRRTTEVQALVALLESLRDLIPDDLREQFRELVRQLLLLVRALIDWWVERMDAGGAPAPSATAPRGPVVEDIPIA